MFNRKWRLLVQSLQAMCRDEVVFPVMQKRRDARPIPRLAKRQESLHHVAIGFLTPPGQLQGAFRPHFG